jgi:DNA-directed RNA polymerase specialized sigma24 family protein
MVSMAKVENVIRISSENEISEVLERKAKLVHSILDAMSPQCKKLLWSFYAEGMNWATIAQQNGLSNANSAKSTANRCRNSFKEKYNELMTKIYGK